LRMANLRGADRHVVLEIAVTGAHRERERHKNAGGKCYRGPRRHCRNGGGPYSEPSRGRSFMTVGRIRTGGAQGSCAYQSCSRPAPFAGPASLDLLLEEEIRIGIVIEAINL